MQNIILQGLPGIGKTTLIKKLINKLKEMNVDVNGFYTEELRENSYRIGFDVVRLDNCRGILARKSAPGDNSKYKVGTYSVHVEEFEKVALPVFDNTKCVLIIDEIGKMELFSKKFQAMIQKAIDIKDMQLIATVPLKSSIPLIQQIKTSDSTQLITVDSANREQLLDHIIPLIKK